MKKSKKLMILGLSAATACVAATSAVSSFAWFATSDTVTATGMKVKIQSSSTLLIGKESTVSSTNGRLADGAGTQAASNTDPTNGIKPTSTTNGKKWFTADALKADDEAAKEKSYAEVGTDSVDSYRLKNTFYLQDFDNTKKSTDSTSKKLVIDKMKITYTSTDTLKSCFRVMTVIDDTTVFVSAPTAASAVSNKGVASVASDGTPTLETLTFATSSIDTDGNVTITANNTLVSTVEYNKVYKADVYLYFDGEDTECYTDNIPTTLKDYEVSISFTLADSGN